MAKVKNVLIQRDWGIRPEKIIISNIVWMVEENERYDLVSFQIEQIDGYFWKNTLAVPTGKTTEQINKICKNYAKTISIKEINDFQNFLDLGNEIGWD